MIAPIKVSAITCTGSGRKRLKSTSGSPKTTSVVPWPRPHNRPISPALCACLRSSSEAIRVVTAARWSGSEACRRPKSRLMSRITPAPDGPCMKPSNQPSIADTQAPPHLSPLSPETRYRDPAQPRYSTLHLLRQRRPHHLPVVLPGEVCGLQLLRRNPPYLRHVIRRVWLAPNDARPESYRQYVVALRSIGVSRQQYRGAYHLDLHPKLLLGLAHEPVYRMFPDLQEPPGRSTRPFSGSRARTDTRAFPSSTITAPTAGAELRYQECPQRGHQAPPLGRGPSRRVPSAGQNLKGSVAVKGPL